MIPKGKKMTTKQAVRKTNVMPLKKIIPHEQEDSPASGSKFFKKNPEVEDDVRMIDEEWNDEDDPNEVEAGDKKCDEPTAAQVNMAILNSLEKLTSLMTENNENTKKIMEKKTENTEKIEAKQTEAEVNPVTQFNDMKKTQKRINMFSRDLSKQLDRVNEDAGDNTNEKNNADFLKVISQNFTALEAEVARNVKKIEQLNRQVETNEKMIAELQKKTKVNTKIVNKEWKDDIPRRQTDKQRNMFDTTEKDTDAENEEGEFEKPKRRRHRKKLPVIPTSPVEIEDDRENDENTTTPPISYAQVINGKFKKPKQPILQKIIDENPEDEFNDKSNIEDDMDDRQREMIEEAIEESSKIIGFSPITEVMKTNEANRIQRSGMLTEMKDRGDLYETATKNLINKFMKNKLQMDNETRRQINIVQIYPSQSDNSPTIYIKCRTEDDISLITSHAHNLPRGDRDTMADTIVHTYQKFYTRDTKRANA